MRYFYSMYDIKISVKKSLLKTALPFYIDKIVDFLSQPN